MSVTTPDRSAEIQEVEQKIERETISVVTARKVNTPPLNFLGILKAYKIPIDTSSPDKLRDELYAGVFLKPNKLKFFVDKKLNKNCFTLFAKELSITWVDDTSFWEWTKEKDASGEEIEVAELLRVCWFEIHGEIWTLGLSPGTLYEIVFVVKIKDDGNIREFSLKLSITPPLSKSITRYESLKDKPLKNWIEIQVGEFMMSPQMVGHMRFSIEELGSSWKSGLFVKSVIIRSKN